MTQPLWVEDRKIKTQENCNIITISNDKHIYFVSVLQPVMNRSFTKERERWRKGEEREKKHLSFQVKGERERKKKNCHLNPFLTFHKFA